MEPQDRQRERDRRGQDPAAIPPGAPADQEDRDGEPEDEWDADLRSPEVGFGAADQQVVDPSGPELGRQDQAREADDRHGRDEDQDGPPLPAQERPQADDAGGDLGQPDERPGRRHAEAEDERSRHQEMDIAVEELRRDRRKEQPGERPSPGEPDQRPGSDGGPEPVAHLEREEPKRGEKPDERRRVVEGPETVGDRVWVRDVNGPVRVEVEAMAGCRQQPYERNQAADRQDHPRGASDEWRRDRLGESAEAEPGRPACVAVDHREPIVLDRRSPPAQEGHPEAETPHRRPARYAVPRWTHEHAFANGWPRGRSWPTGPWARSCSRAASRNGPALMSWSPRART